MLNKLRRHYSEWLNKKDPSFVGSKFAGQSLTEYERKLLWPGDSCPDCNVTGNLYFWATSTSGEPGTQDCVCGNCGAEFMIRSASGKRRNNKGIVEPLRLRNRFRFTDDMVSTIVKRQEYFSNNDKH